MSSNPIGIFWECFALASRSVSNFHPFSLLLFTESDEIILPNARVPPLSDSRSKNQPDLANALSVVLTLEARENKEERGAISERCPLAGRS
jgi:hypothetical protein